MLPWPFIHHSLITAYKRRAAQWLRDDDKAVVDASNNLRPTLEDAQKLEHVGFILLVMLPHCKARHLNHMWIT